MSNLSPALLKTAKVTSSQGPWPSQEEPKETRQLKAMPRPGWDPGQRTGIGNPEQL